jgi:hypothetical protein
VGVVGLGLVRWLVGDVRRGDARVSIGLRGAGWL